MESFKDKWASTSLPSEAKSKLSGEVHIDRYFVAGRKLDFEEVEYVLESGDVDVNAVYSYGSTREPGKPVDHMLQTFGYSSFGKITCQIFEKIDDEEMILKISHMLQVYQHQ